MVTRFPQNRWGSLEEVSGKAGEGPVCTADAQLASVYLIEMTGDHHVRDDLCCVALQLRLDRHRQRDCSLKSGTLRHWTGRRI